MRTIAWHNTILHDAEGAIAGTLSSGEDVTERRRAEQQITYLAYHDPLTGLANRTLLREHLNLALARSRRTGAEVALLHMDVDGFKLVNDSLGHAAGDELILRLAARLQESTRATDLVARGGGDGFLLLLADLHEEPLAAAERVATEIVACLAEPFLVAGAEFQVSASIGVALSPRDARERRHCSRMPTRRCTGPRTSRVAAGPYTRRPGAIRWSGSRRPPGCAGR